MTPLVLSLREGQTVAMPLPGPVREALAAGTHTAAALEDAARASAGASGVVQLHLCLGQYARLGILDRTLIAEGRRCVTVEGPWRFTSDSAAPLREDARYRLSRFALLRRDGDACVLESPRTRLRLVLHDARAAALVGLLAVPREPRECARPLLDLLAGLTLAVPVDDRGAGVEESTPPIDAWRLDEMVLHARSRCPSGGPVIGGTFRFRGTLPPAPALKAPMSAGVLPLDRPELHVPPGGEVPRSAPMARRQLGEILYRARVRSTLEATSDNGRSYDTTNRPYPSGGAAHELEIYVVARGCGDLADGLYHYDPAAHALERLPDPDGSIVGGSAPVRLAITSRFQRRSWKYEGIAYANTLRGLGVLCETLRLAAASTGVASRAVEVEPGHRLARLAGLDPEAEDVVGGFELGDPAMERV